MKQIKLKENYIFVASCFDCPFILQSDILKLNKFVENHLTKTHEYYCIINNIKLEHNIFTNKFPEHCKLEESDLDE